MRNLTIGLTVSLILAGCGGGGDSPSTTNTSSSNSNPSAPPSPPATNNNTSKLPNIVFTVDRSEINELQTATVSWSVTDATSCTGGQDMSGSQPLNSFKRVSYREGTQTFELTCTGAGGSTTKTTTVKSVQPVIDFAGAWYPVAAQSIKEGYDGTIVGSFYNHVKIGNSQRNGIALVGWGYKGWDYKGNETAIVRTALFEPDSNGLLRIATSKYITDPNTNGSAAVIVTDVNNDSYDDIVYVSHNETPIEPKASTYYLGSASGVFSKRVTSDKLAAHDAQLLTVNGKEKIFTGVVTGHPRNAYYEFVNGDLNPTYTTNLSYYQNNFLQLGNMSQTIITNKNNESVLVTAGGCRNINGSCDKTINTFSFNGSDISRTAPVQSITPYLSTLTRFSNVVAQDGKGQTHVYRVWSLDLNKDGNLDVLSAQSMWHQDVNLSPVGLQLLINDGKNNLSDYTDKLNFSMNLEQETLDPSPRFIDIDNSGIETLFFANFAMNKPTKHSNYVLLNDGTGLLHVALHNEFYNLTDRVYNIMKARGYKFPISNPSVNWQLPKFIAVPQPDGSINFLAEVKTNFKNINPENGMEQNTHLFVNLMTNYNPAYDFVKDVVVSDRNNSQKMRTWAGYDTFYDKNAVRGTTIDGGKGFNKVQYSDASTNYTIVKNSNGTYRITSSSNNIDDTLTRIQNIVFTDKTITLE